MFKILIASIFSSCFVKTCVGTTYIDAPLESWTDGTTSGLINNGAAMIASNGSSDYPECVWLIGGYSSCSGRCVTCYNTTEDSFVAWDDYLQYQWSMSYVQHSAFMLGNDIYYLSYAGGSGSIQKYNVKDKTDTQLFYPTTVGHHECIVNHPRLNNYMFVVGISDTGSNSFFVYNNDTGSYVQGNNLNHGRDRGTCGVSDYLDDPYVYVVGGDTIYFERMNLNDAIVNTSGATWQVLNAKLDCVDNYGCYGSGSWAGGLGLHAFDKYIFILSGFYVSSWSENVLVYDVENDFYNYSTATITSPTEFRSGLANNRLYMFMWDGTYWTPKFSNNLLDALVVESS